MRKPSLENCDQCCNPTDYDEHSADGQSGSIPQCQLITTDMTGGPKYLLIAQFAVSTKCYGKKLKDNNC